MRKILSFTLLATIALSGCNKKEDDAFDQSPDERINETLAEYQSALVKAPYGWKGLIYPAGTKGGVFAFYFKFNDSNRVEMFSDFDSTSNVTPATSSYRLKALQQPSLLFDTYSYIHVLSDPDGSVNGGDYGTGLGSDFEFAIMDVGTDTIKLTGRFNGSKAYLIKATQQEADDYYSKRYKTRVFANHSKILNYFKRLVVGSNQYQIKINQVAHTITFTWVDGNGNEQTYTTGYYYTTDGIALTPSFTDGSITISGFSNMTWNATTATLSFSVNSDAAYIYGLGTPIKPDLDAPQRWWQYAADREIYWVSENGFHVNGVDDAYGITKVPNYYYFIYFPVYDTYSGGNYDVAAPIKVVNNALTLQYGGAYRKPTFSTNGKVVFPYLGSLGAYPTAADSVAMTRSRIQLSESTGYYFVQTGNNSYDMVNAKDGKAWISWEVPQ